MPEKARAVVVLSGGQDSVTAFYYALLESDVVAAIFFNYGQRHHVELTCAEYHAQQMRVPLVQLDIPALAQLGNSALVSFDGDVAAAHSVLPSLPASFVPGRNLIFLTLAAAAAFKYEAHLVYSGVCQADYSGYPDCREETINALEWTCGLGMKFPGLKYVSPLMNLSKSQTFALADELGILGEIIDHTHTCYNGDHMHKHEWGYGCDACPSCNVRKRGWQEFQLFRGNVHVK